MGVLIYRDTSNEYHIILCVFVCVLLGGEGVLKYIFLINPLFIKGHLKFAAGDIYRFVAPLGNQIWHLNFPAIHHKCRLLPHQLKSMYFGGLYSKQ